MRTAYDWRWVERTFLADLDLLRTQWRLAWRLYLSDVAEHKRNSGLGLLAPFLSVLVHVVLLGSVMSLVFSEPLATFLPFFAMSFALWQGISIFISLVSYSNDKAARFLSFPNLSGFISNLMASYEFLVAVGLKLLAAMIIIAFVNPSILITANYPAFLCGFALLSLALVTWSLPAAYALDRFRLLRGFLPQILFLIYLVTPILWTPERIHAHRWVVDFNPVFHLIESARAPILDGTWPLVSFACTLAVSIVGIVLTYAAFTRNRELVVYRWIA